MTKTKLTELEKLLAQEETLNVQRQEELIAEQIAYDETLVEARAFNQKYEAKAAKFEGLLQRFVMLKENPLSDPEVLAKVEKLLEKDRASLNKAASNHLLVFLQKHEQREERRQKAVEIAEELRIFKQDQLQQVLDYENAAEQQRKTIMKLMRGEILVPVSEKNQERSKEAGNKARKVEYFVENVTKRFYWTIMKYAKGAAPPGETWLTYENHEKFMEDVFWQATDPFFDRMPSTQFQIIQKELDDDFNVCSHTEIVTAKGVDWKGDMEIIFSEWVYDVWTARYVTYQNAKEGYMAWQKPNTNQSLPVLQLKENSALNEVRDLDRQIAEARKLNTAPSLAIARMLEQQKEQYLANQIKR